ncbi:MAG TPA: beta-ketoacyl-ACP synthase II [Dehalococcoidales bacterium]|nr:beta-ketoacyl-ACP synthase II [Dehalococcoidales bacterium]
MKNRRVVVTGIGLLTPLAIGIENNWNSLVAGESGISRITSFDASGDRTQIAGEVKGFDPQEFIEKKVARRVSRFIQLALAAARMALKDSGLVISEDNAERIGTAVASAVGGIDSFEKNHNLVIQNKRDRVSPFFIPSYICNLGAGEVAIAFGLKGPLMCSVTACAAGTHSIGEAFRTIQYGDADVMLAGGAEAQLTRTLFAGLDALHVLSTRNHEPAKASRPFEKNRDGFVISEGSGILVLEELEFARSRGARIYAEILGYGSNCDAYHITSPHAEGTGAAGCMQKAIKDAGLTENEIDCINAHGTSTISNDLTETRAIKRVFGDRAFRIPVSANKSMLGHLWGAAGAVEAAISVLTLARNVIPPTINYEVADPECNLDYVPDKARNQSVNYVLSNSFGFGGTNACLVFGRYS